jgi:hypothetical protein
MRADRGSSARGVLVPPRPTSAAPSSTRATPRQCSMSIIATQTDRRRPRAIRHAAWIDAMPAEEYVARTVERQRRYEALPRCARHTSPHGNGTARGITRSTNPGARTPSRSPTARTLVMLRSSTSSCGGHRRRDRGDSMSMSTPRSAGRGDRRGWTGNSNAPEPRVPPDSCRGCCRRLEGALAPSQAWGGPDHWRRGYTASEPRPPRPARYPHMSARRRAHMRTRLKVHTQPHTKVQTEGWTRAQTGSRKTMHRVSRTKPQQRAGM